MTPELLAALDALADIGRSVIVCDCCGAVNRYAADDPGLARPFPKCASCGWPMDRKILNQPGEPEAAE